MTIDSKSILSSPHYEPSWSQLSWARSISESAEPCSSYLISCQLLQENTQTVRSCRKGKDLSRSCSQRQDGQSLQGSLQYPPTELDPLSRKGHSRHIRCQKKSDMGGSAGPGYQKMSLEQREARGSNTIESCAILANLSTRSHVSLTSMVHDCDLLGGEKTCFLPLDKAAIMARVFARQ